MHQYESGPSLSSASFPFSEESKMVIQLPPRATRPPMTDRDAERHIATGKPRRSWPARHAVLMIALAVVTFAGSVTAATLAGKSVSDARIGVRPAYTTAEAAAGIGTAVRDGDFEFTVTAVDAGVADIGTVPIVAAARGQFIIIHLTVKNTGAAERTFDPGSQTMIDQRGEMWPSDVTAGRAVEPNNFVSGVTPGSSITGVVVFDLARDAVPTQTQLHESAFSRGVTVQLSR